MSAPKLSDAALAHASRRYDDGYKAGVRDAIGRADALDRAIRSSDLNSGPKTTEMIVERAAAFAAFVRRGR